MAKTLAILLAAASLTGAEAKQRPLYSAFDENTAPVVANSHERKVREPLVHECSMKHQQVASSREPTVGAGSCSSQCLFQDDQNEWCFSTTAPMLTTGWNWAQNTGTNFWLVEFQPYRTT